MGRLLSAAVNNAILSRLHQQQTGCRISASLNVSTAAVSRLRSKSRSTLSQGISGRPRKLSPANIRYARHLITSGRVDTATEVAQIISDSLGHPVSAQTVRRALKQSGLKAVVKKKRPLLTKKHRRERMDWASAHQDWTVDDWKRVVWSDETKINRLGSDGKRWAWKKGGEGLTNRLIRGTLKFGGGSLMLWDCMMWDGAGQACKIDGRMDSVLYCSILEDELLGSLEEHDRTINEVMFQHDNDPKHTSKLTRKWLEDHNIIVLPWPAQSPDLNPIEHLWCYIKMKLGEYPDSPSGINELWGRVQAVWDAIPKEVCQGLIESMPARVAAVLKAKGGYTKY
jgi:transposase